MKGKTNASRDIFCVDKKKPPFSCYVKYFFFSLLELLNDLKKMKNGEPETEKQTNTNRKENGDSYSLGIFNLIIVVCIVWSCAKRCVLLFYFFFFSPEKSIYSDYIWHIPPKYITSLSHFIIHWKYANLFIVLS